MWTFNISAGSLSKDGIMLDRDVYSGAFPEGFNDPSKTAIENVGPIPEGDYDFTGMPFTDAEHGPYVLKIVPRAGTEMFGRSGFLLHGKPLPPKDIRCGSEGCICACLQTRVRVYQSGDSWLRVISGLVVAESEVGQ
jgi:hypothetical protein